MVVDVTVVFSHENRKFEIRRLYDGFVLHTSGLFKNRDNAIEKIKNLCVENDWRLDRMVHL